MLDRIGPIALALLHGITPERLDGVDLSGVAAVGSIATENLGIEHLVENLVANPHIRHLVVFGHDTPGHLAGDALVCFSAQGIEPSGRIPGARGARPVLKNLTPVEVEHFRSRVGIVDLIGSTDPAMLAERLAALRRMRPEPWEYGLRVERVPTVQARPAERVTLDRAGWFVILPAAGREHPMRVEHYTNDGVLRNVIEGWDAATICATIIRMKLVSRLDHAAYLGRELAAADYSRRAGRPYVQDRAQGDCAPDDLPRT